MAEAEKIGEVTHYFDKIGVAIIKADKPLKIGDAIEIRSKKGEAVAQTIDSMQIDRKDIEEAKVGEEVGVKVAKEVHEGNEVYRG